tara:strand:+ start:112 stop:363 length:252 start_codon:yes stop_codon:yes gene_type:complete
MKDKILLDGINSKSLNELTDIAGKIIEKLEKTNNLESLAEDYQNLIKLNNIIQTKFKKNSKQISINTKEKIKKIIKKNVKKIK